MTDLEQSEHARRVDAIHLRVRAGRAEIYADLRHRDQVTVSFGAGVYPWLSEHSLEHYLASIGRLLVAAWTRAYVDSLDDAIRETRGVHDQRDRAFAEERERISASGVSSDGRVLITAHGMSDVRVFLADDTIRDLAEREFADRTREAAAHLVADYMEQVRDMQDRYYG